MYLLSVTVNEDVCRITTCLENVNTCDSTTNTHTNSTTVFWKKNCSDGNIKQLYTLIDLSDLLNSLSRASRDSVLMNLISAGYTVMIHNECSCVYNVLTVFVIISSSNNELYKYSTSWFVWHFQDQRLARHCTFPHIGTLYLMCILVYLATTWPNITT